MTISDTTQELRIRFSTRPRFTRKIYDIITGLLDVMINNKAAQREFVIGLSEAIDNAIIHGNRLNQTKYIELHCVITPTRITCNISDEGDGFDFSKFLGIPLQEFSPQALMGKVSQYGSPGSMGIALMRKCINEINYTSPGNTVTLIKYL
ncbi:MAG: ATP-binding protein [Planctomycetes bacterium]|nr:ATP-binding protein [Planctomycetota bacterium]